MKNPRLTYCTNVHSLTDLAGWEETLEFYGPAIRARMGWDRLPLGLWFPASLLEELSRLPDKGRGRVKSLLERHNLSTFTCNAFPNGNFHDPVVKTKVYRPDWTEQIRLDYTVACAHLLAYLLPSGEDGSLSTLPLGWRAGWSDAQSRRAAQLLCDWVAEARNLASREGKVVRLGLEPEPGCALETAAQVVGFWDRHLRPAARSVSLPQEDLDAFCGICYDTCHQAVQFEDPALVLDRLAAAGIPIVKMQLSSALEFHPDPERRSAALRRQFIEEKFLHQTRVKTPDGIVSFDDLPEALAAEADWAAPWRVHFHLPVHASAVLDPAWIGTTRDDMLRAYRHALEKGLCSHFEVETYTWSVMPPELRPSTRDDLARCLASELAYIVGETPPGVALNA